MEGIVFQNEAFMILHLAGMSNEFLLGQLRVAVEDRADGNAARLNGLFKSAAKFFRPEEGKMRAEPVYGADVGGGGGDGVDGVGGGGEGTKEALMKEAVRLRNDGDLTGAMELMKKAKAMEG